MYIFDFWLRNLGNEIRIHWRIVCDRAHAAHEEKLGEKQIRKQKHRHFTCFLFVLRALSGKFNHGLCASVRATTTITSLAI